MKEKRILSANPGACYLSKQNEINSVIVKVLESGQYILGKNVSLFEQMFANYIGVKYGIGVASGTDAILLALKACNIGYGDAVVTVSHTAVATVAAIVISGARPILIDIDEKTYTIDVTQLEETIRDNPEFNIKAVIPVHLYGHPADMNVVMKVADRYNLFVIEDCSQAHGAKIKSRKVGSIGHLGVFSFYPTKNLSAIGDGGAIVTDNQQLFERIILLRQYGWRKRYISDIAGMNSRLDEIQAAILQVKLKYLDEENIRRRNIALQYSKKLSGLPLKLPIEKDDYYHVYHQYVIRSSDRDSIKNFLTQNNIGTSILYPEPIHLQPGYAQLILRGKRELRVTEKICKDILCLPIYPELSDEDVSYICDMIYYWHQHK